MKILHSPRIWSGLIILLFSLGSIVWSFWYFPPNSESFPLTSFNTAMKTSYPDWNGQYWITVSWTPVIEVGNQGYLWIRLDPKNSPQAGKTSPQIPAYNSCAAAHPSPFCAYNLLTEARVDLPGMDISPAGAVSKAWQDGQILEYAWNTRSSAKGSYSGTIWFYLEQVPKTSGDAIVQPLLARHVTLTTINFLGLDAVFWRLLGGVGVLIGAALWMSYKKK
jgi:hypothetical protein